MHFLVRTLSGRTVSRPAHFAIEARLIQMQSARQTCVISAAHGETTSDLRTNFRIISIPITRAGKRNTTPEQESCALPASFQGNITAHHDLSKDWSLARPTSAFPSNVRGTRIRSDSRRAIPRRAGLSCLDFLVRTSSLYAQASECSRPAIDLRNFCSARARCSRPLARQTCVLSARMGRGHQDTSVQIPYHLHPSPRREKEHNSRAGVLRTPGILPRKHHSTCTTFPKIGASHETRPLLSRPTSVAHGLEATPVALSHGEPVYRAWISLCALCRSTHRPRSAVGRQSPFAIFGALCFRSVECAPWKPRICLQAPATFEFRRKDDALV